MKQFIYVFSSKRRFFFCCPILILLFAGSGCKKYLEVGSPKNGLVADVVFNDDRTATSALLSIYTNFLNPAYSSNPGMSADELVSFDNSPYYQNALIPSPQNAYWNLFYNKIFIANSVIEGLNKSHGVSETVREILLAEAKFNRAFFHFYLMNWYGAIPYATSTDYRINQSIRRDPTDSVFRFIINDLLDAQAHLPDQYVGQDNLPSDEKVRPNKMCATALLARMFLYTGDYEKAEKESTRLLENTNYSLLSDLDQVFLKNNNEAIWQLQPSIESYTNGPDGPFYILKSNPAYSESKVALSDNLLAAFEPGDKRRAHWIGSYNEDSDTWYYAFKYKEDELYAPTTEYYMVLRLAEQYLIRAESRIYLNNIAGAVADLNQIRGRARNLSTDLPDLMPSITPEECLNAVLHERQCELFLEWGHRWADLRRTGKADEILAPVKGNNWQTTDQLYPIPRSETERNPNMHQNPGY